MGARLKVDGSPVTVVPVEPCLDMLQGGREAARAVRMSAACGMTLESQIKAQSARENAAYRAMLAASDPVLTAVVIEMREALAGVMGWHGSDDDDRWQRRAEMALARITVEDASDE